MGTSTPNLNPQAAKRSTLPPAALPMAEKAARWRGGSGDPTTPTRIEGLYYFAGAPTERGPKTLRDTIIEREPLHFYRAPDELARPGYRSERRFVEAEEETLP